MLQTHIKEGPITLDATADLTGKRGYLVKIVNSSNVPRFALPSAITDICTHVITDDGALDSGGTYSVNVSATPLTGNRQALIKVKGAILPGAQVVLADPSTAADAGKIRTTAAIGSGTYASVGVLEGVTAADGDFAIVRPTGHALVTV